MSQNVAHAKTPATIEERIGSSIDRTVTRELSVIDTGGGGTLSFGSMSEVLEFSKIMAAKKRRHSFTQCLLTLLIKTCLASKAANEHLLQF